MTDPEAGEPFQLRHLEFGNRSCSVIWSLNFLNAPAAVSSNARRYTVHPNARYVR
jgi:hypothetical protein